MMHRMEQSRQQQQGMVSACLTEVTAVWDCQYVGLYVVVLQSCLPILGPVVKPSKKIFETPVKAEDFFQVSEPQKKTWFQTFRATCGPLLIWSPTLKHRGPPDGKGYVVTGPTCGPLQILFPHIAGVM